jgi:hypothetical protein
MKIETKYEPYQEVWHMRNNRPAKLHIMNITAHYEGYYLDGIRGSKLKITYMQDHQTFDREENLFPSKEALLESLK